LVDIEDENPVDYWTKIGLPADYLRIPYIDLCQIGRWGWQCFTANPYPARFEKLLTTLRKAGITQYGAYSEDIHDDINKFLLARLGISSKRSASQLIDEYCMQYFRAGVGREVYKVACMMEEERTNKFKSPWVQEVIWDKEKAHEMLAILQEMEDRLPTYVVEGWRWQVLIKRAEISWLINDLGQMDDFQTSMRKLMDDVATCVRVEEAKDIIQKASLLIEGKRKIIEMLMNLIEDFRNEVLQEPMDRGVNIHGVFESISGSYFAWQKMLLEYEETIFISGRGGMIKRIQKAFKEGLENVKGEFEG